MRPPLSLRDLERVRRHLPTFPRNPPTVLEEERYIPATTLVWAGVYPQRCRHTPGRYYSRR